MQTVLLENESLVAHIEQLRSDAEIIDSSELDAVTKHQLVMRLFFAPRPLTPQSKIERQHFAKSGERNKQQARRMARLRERQQLQQKGNENGLD
jgi:hypothetical protein